MSAKQGKETDTNLGLLGLSKASWSYKKIPSLMPLLSHTPREWGISADLVPAPDLMLKFIYIYTTTPNPRALPKWVLPPTSPPWACQLLRIEFTWLLSDVLKTCLWFFRLAGLFSLLKDAAGGGGGGCDISSKLSTSERKQRAEISGRGGCLECDSLPDQKSQRLRC